MSAACIVEQAVDMEVVATCAHSSSPVVGSAVTQDGRRREAKPVRGLMASIVLHAVVLAAVIEWDGNQTERFPPPLIEVTLVAAATPVAIAPPQPTATQAISPPQDEPVPPHAMIQKAGPDTVTVQNPPVPSTRHRAEPAMRRTLARPAKPGTTISPAEPTGTPASPDPANTPGNATTHDSQATIETGEAAGRGPPARAANASATPSAGNPAPVYPMTARRAGREGRTILRVWVSTTGECSEVQIVETSGTPSLDEAALAAVRRWRFSPATQAGRAVETTITVPIAFKLTDTLE